MGISIQDSLSAVPLKDMESTLLALESTLVNGKTPKCMVEENTLFMEVWLT